MPGSKFEKKAFKQKKVTNSVCFLNIAGKQQHFNLTNGMLVYLFNGMEKHKILFGPATRFNLDT